MRRFVLHLESIIQNDSNLVHKDDLSAIKNEITAFFNDSSEIIYIPAGRSIITLLSTQLNYIYSFMDAVQTMNLGLSKTKSLMELLRILMKILRKYGSYLQYKTNILEETL